MLFKHMGWNLAILAVALLIVGSLVLALVEAIPGKSCPVEVRESVSVSSSLLNASSGSCQAELSGLLWNPSDSDVGLTLSVTVSGKGLADTVVFENVSMPARTGYEIRRVWEVPSAKTVVDSVVVSIDGADYRLTNSPDSAFNGAVLLFLILAALLGLLLAFLIKQRYYRWQEDTAGKE